MNLNFLLIPIAGQEEPVIPKTLSERAMKARAIWEFRRKRDLHIPAELFGEPGWDILLMAFISDAEGTDWPVTSICAGSGSSATTALRWIATLIERGYIRREADPTDKRRQYIRMTAEGRATMNAVLDRTP